MVGMFKVAAVAIALGTGVAAWATAPVASYSFAGTLAANEAAAPDLVAIDPLAANGFETALVHGQSRTVYHWAGDGASSDRQAGLTLDASGLHDLGQYSLAFSFEFLGTASTGSGWRRLVDTQGRQSDNGLYVSPVQVLQVVQGTELGGGQMTDGSTLFTTPGFHDVFLAVADTGAGSQQVKVWLDGQLELTATTTWFSLANGNNPGHLLTLFADNLAAGAQQEYANGRIAALALYDGALSPSAVPEPAPAALLLAGGLTLALRARRRG